MKISFENAKKLLAEIEHLKFVDDKNYWKYCSLYEDVAWEVYFNGILEHDCIELDNNLCDRLGDLINEFKEVE